MNERPPQLSPRRIVAGALMPLAAYLLIRAAIGSATGALAITEGIAGAWLLITGVARRRLDPVGVICLVTVACALLAYALTGGDALALRLRRGAVTGTLGIASLASIALGRPLLLLVAEHAAKLNPERRSQLAQPGRRRRLAMLTAIIGLTFAIDGVSQMALAFTVPTGTFLANSTAARILVFGTGLIVTVWYLRRGQERGAMRR